MADEESTKDIQLLKRTRISVFVDEALPDILVVTYNHGVKIFKGVLLDSTKKNIPCGIQSLNPAFKTTKPKPDDDPLYSVSQRFAYTDPGMAKKKTTQMTGRHKHGKMTVRLRPRQVLCSKCKGICNENSENVSRKRKSTSESAPPPNLPPIKRGLNAPVTRSVSIYTTEQNKKKLGGEATLIPKLTRLTAEQERSVLNRSSTTTTTTTTTTSHLRQLRNVHKKRRGEVGAEKSEATVAAAAAAPPVVVASNKENQEDSHRQHSEDHSADDEDDDDEGRGRDKDREDEEEEGEEEDDSSNSDDEDDDDKNDSTRHRPDEHHNRSALTCYVSSRPTDRRTLRKKRSIGSMEDLWDEAVFEKHAKRSNLLPHEEETDPLAIPEDPLNTNTSTLGGGSTNNNNGLGTSTRTIKISYGPQGEGTVLKIPAQIDKLLGERGAGARTTSSNSTSSIEDNFVGADEDATNTGSSSSVLPPPPVPAMLGDDSNDKAARRALKRAKKEARRKVFTRAGGSPLYLSSSSPRYSIMGNSSPRYTVGSASPRHGLGNNSPRYMVAPYELNIPRRRKHKMKHKKKHKEDRDKKHKEAEVSSTQDESKEQQQQFVTQKLSINLKRLNNTLYTSYPVTTTTSQESQQQQQQQPPRSAEDENNTSSSSSDEHGNYNEQRVPDFPPPNPPLMLRINSQTLASATTADGGRMLVGDVVWGKIHGFPWWPGKVLTITNCGGQGGRPRAHVAWYGSSTSSLMRCDQLSPYLENFKIRYNKKKRGPYKEAIKQATLEARENAESRSRQPSGNSPSHSNIITSQVVPPALASPREIDVAS